MTRGNTHYCARCLAPATPRLQACTRCAAPFTGSGSYDLVCGPRPSGEFAFLFDSAPASSDGASFYQASF
jgi:predicted amidophosphoribosyltransferase